MKKRVCTLVALMALAGLVFAQSPNDFNFDINRTFDAITITGYTGTATRVVIPAEIEGIPVRTIGHRAFNSNRNITEVIIPDTVTTIANSPNFGAFAYASNLVSVTLSNNLEVIGDLAFRHTGLTTINLPDGLTTIGAAVFASCPNLTSITIPSTVTSIGRQAFVLSGLTAINLPDGLTTISREMFRTCRNLTSITIPSTVTSIERQAFAYSGLTSITIPNSVREIDDYAFQDTRNLTIVVIEEGASIRFANNAFSGSNLNASIQIALRRAGYEGRF